MLAYDANEGKADKDYEIQSSEKQKPEKKLVKSFVNFNMSDDEDSSNQKGEFNIFDTNQIAKQ